MRKMTNKIIQMQKRVQKRFHNNSTRVQRKTTTKNQFYCYVCSRYWSSSIPILQTLLFNPEAFQHDIIVFDCVVDCCVPTKMMKKNTQYIATSTSAVTHTNILFFLIAPA